MLKFSKYQLRMLLHNLKRKSNRTMAWLSWYKLCTERGGRRNIHDLYFQGSSRVRLVKHLLYAPKILRPQGVQRKGMTFSKKKKILKFGPLNKLEHLARLNFIYWSFFDLAQFEPFIHFFKNYFSLLLWGKKLLFFKKIIKYNCIKKLFFR